MIACKQCQTPNGLDSKFCKNCGQPLSDDAIRNATGKHDQMVKEGYALFNAGLTNEALLVAQAAVEENPTSPTPFLFGNVLRANGTVGRGFGMF